MRPVCHLSEEDNRAEIQDRMSFAGLLSKLLALDVDQRIKPSEVLRDSFITMTDLAENFPKSFQYVSILKYISIYEWTNVGLTLFFFSLKSSFEAMEICWRQRSKSVRSGQASNKESYRSADLQCISNLNPTAWLDRRERPLIQGIASDICSRLSIYGHCSLPKGKPSSLSFYPERSQSRRQFHPPASSNQFYSLKANGEYLEANTRYLSFLPNLADCSWMTIEQF